MGFGCPSPKEDHVEGGSGGSSVMRMTLQRWGGALIYWHVSHPRQLFILTVGRQRWRCFGQQIVGGGVPLRGLRQQPASIIEGQVGKKLASSFFSLARQLCEGLGGFKLGLSELVWDIGDGDGVSQCLIVDDDNDKDDKVASGADADLVNEDLNTERGFPEQRSSGLVSSTKVAVVLR